jgi:hypothetical protein
MSARVGMLFFYSGEIGDEPGQKFFAGRALLLLEGLKQGRTNNL